MPRKKKEASAYNGGHIRLTKYGTYRAELCLGGVQWKRTFKERSLAESWISVTRIDWEQRNLPLNADEVREAREAWRMLPPGVGLLEVIRQWVRENNVITDPTPAEAALERMLAEKCSLALRPRSIESVRQHVRAFLRDFPGLQCHEVTAGMVKDWLTSTGRQGETWNNYRRDLHNFFAWCVRERYISRNPVSDVAKARIERGMPQCFTVAAVKAFLKVLREKEPALVPYYAIGFFAGVRSAELDRLDGSCIGPELIHIGPHQAKVRQQRYVTIQPNLRAWLDLFPPSKGKLRQTNQRRRFENLVAKVKLDDEPLVWVENGMRHSFASYHLSAFKDAGRTALELGHQSPSLLFSRYRTLAAEAEGLEYFAITPESLDKD
jgi:site-specific recombinase XerD